MTTRGVKYVCKCFGTEFFLEGPHPEYIRQFGSPVTRTPSIYSTIALEYAVMNELRTLLDLFHPAQYCGVINYKNFLSYLRRALAGVANANWCMAHELGEPIEEDYPFATFDVGRNGYYFSENLTRYVFIKIDGWIFKQPARKDSSVTDEMLEYMADKILSAEEGDTEFKAVLLDYMKDVKREGEMEL